MLRFRVSGAVCEDIGGMWVRCMRLVCACMHSCGMACVNPAHMCVCVHICVRVCTQLSWWRRQPLSMWGNTLFAVMVRPHDACGDG